MQKLPDGIEARSTDNLVKLAHELWVHLKLTDRENEALKADVKMMLDLQRRKWIENDAR
jgi:hypothetical protein